MMLVVASTLCLQCLQRVHLARTNKYDLGYTVLLYYSPLVHNLGPSVHGYYQEK
jgi:hypothetical protein